MPLDEPKDNPSILPAHRSVRCRRGRTYRGAALNETRRESAGVCRAWVDFERRPGHGRHPVQGGAHWRCRQRYHVVFGLRRVFGFGRKVGQGFNGDARIGCQAQAIDIVSARRSIDRFAARGNTRKKWCDASQAKRRWFRLIPFGQVVWCWRHRRERNDHAVRFNKTIWFDMRSSGVVVFFCGLCDYARSRSTHGVLCR